MRGVLEAVVGQDIAGEDYGNLGVDARGQTRRFDRQYDDSG
jgi:hypothetical protein